MQYIFHSKGQLRQPRVTVVAVVEQGNAKFGVSRCSKRDQFVRKTGREMALQRAFEKPLYQLPAPGEAQGKWFLAWAKAIAELVKLNPEMV